jgi:hypothetical protein
MGLNELDLPRKSDCNRDNSWFSDSTTAPKSVSPRVKSDIERRELETRLQKASILVRSRK